MTITWLDDECNEAELTRGFWRVRRAIVSRHEDGRVNSNGTMIHFSGWKYLSGRSVEFDLDRMLERRRTLDLRRRDREEDWSPIRPSRRRLKAVTP